MRDTNRLDGHVYDAVVIGAGIYGAVLTYHLTMAGARVLALDKNDFCAATSANSLKILHGGLRYLQHLDFKRMRESIVSRRALMQFSPHLVRPLGCLVPTTGYGLRSRMVMEMATLANNWISCDRNQDLPPSVRVPAGKTISKKSLLDKVPGLKNGRLTGGTLWYDGLAVNTERLALEHLLAARDEGADIVNYVRVDGVTHHQGTVAGVVATDIPTGKSIAVSTKWVVNAAGPWFEEVLRNSGIASPKTAWAKAVNLVVSRQINPEYAVGLEGLSSHIDHRSLVERAKRNYFLVPWREGTLIGTTYKAFSEPAETLQVTEQDIDEIISEVNDFYPAWGLTRQDVTFFHTGLLPMSDVPSTQRDHVPLAKHSLIVDHGKKGGPSGLISIRSIKYTTAPQVAARVTRMVTGEAGARKPMRYGLDSAPQNLQAEKRSLLPLLEGRYGRRAPRVLAHVVGEDPRSWWLSRKPDLLFAEIRYFVHEELARTLADVVLRRTDIGTLGRPDAALLEKIARVMARELEWDEPRLQSEISAVQAVYAPVETAP